MRFENEAVMKLLFIYFFSLLFGSSRSARHSAAQTRTLSKNGKKGKQFLIKNLDESNGRKEVRFTLTFKLTRRRVQCLCRVVRNEKGAPCRNWRERRRFRRASGKWNSRMTRAAWSGRANEPGAAASFSSERLPWERRQRRAHWPPFHYKKHRRRLSGKSQRRRLLESPVAERRRASQSIAPRSSPFAILVSTCWTPFPPPSATEKLRFIFPSPIT